MSWNTLSQLLSADNSSYLGLFGSIGDGSMIGGGVTYLCNQTAMGFILNLPVASPPVVLKQITQVAIQIPGGPYPTYSATFPNPTTPGNLLVAVFTSTFLSSLFDVAISDSTFLGWSAPYPTNGHVPGESNTLQVFLAISTGGTPTVTITQTGFSNMTAGSLILFELQGPNGTIAFAPSAFHVGGPATLTIAPTPTNPGDLMLMAISLMQACPIPGITPFGGGTTIVSPPGPGNRIPPNSLPVISLPFCFSEKCRIFE